MAGSTNSGSSDAAATLLAVSVLFGLRLDYAELAPLGAEIGSDIPFFFSTGQALISGRGEVVRPIVCPTAISTAVSHAALSLPLTSGRNPFSLGRCGTASGLIESLKPAGNDFEKVQFSAYPEIERIRDELLQCGALLARLSGSGPTVFGLFEQKPTDQSRRLSGHNSWQVTIARPVLLAARLP